MTQDRATVPDHPALANALLLAIPAVGWGANWPILKVLLAEVPPLAARGWAGVLAGAALAVIATGQRAPLRVPRAMWGRLALASFLNVTAWMGFTTLGLWWLNAGEAAILAYTMPIWAILFGWLLLGQRPTPRQIVALAAGMAALWIMFGGFAPSLPSGTLPGVLFTLAAAILFAIGTTMAKRWPLGLDPVASTAWQVALGCLPLLLLSFVLEDADFAALSTGGWLAFLYMAAVPLCACYVAWFAALERVSPTQAAITTLMAPVIGVSAGALWLSEPFDARIAFAALLTLGGVALVTLLPQAAAR